MKIWGNRSVKRRVHRAWVLNFVLAALWVSLPVANGAESSLEHWIQDQTKRSLDFMIHAISPSDGALGSVMASPSRSQPDYYAFWVRDGSLVMREVWNYRSVNGKLAQNTLKDFALFSRRLQGTSNWSGAAYDLGIGEPKFEIDGHPYEKGWGRPQNDGPALRVSALLGLADDLMRSSDREFVNQVLYRAEMPARTVIKADLEYVAHHWQDSSFDLWEEVRGDHFYTRIAQWRALLDGAVFAQRMGDSSAAKFYKEQSVLVLGSLNAFWSGSKGYLMATRNRIDGAGDKYSSLDIAVILGVLHSGKSGFPFSVDDDRVIATMFQLEQAFDYAYPLNREKTNPDGFQMAPGIGRYPEDRYDGYRTDRQGNPWFLSTHAMAEYLLRLRGELKAQGGVKITDVSRPFFESLLRTNLRTKRSLQAGDMTFGALLKALADRSDAYIRRSQFHTDRSGHQSEQFNRVDGYMQGARDLTWSYASFLSLRRIRDHFYE
ncbi:MAG: glycoside hydrolase family 15 protein [Cryobacterium sp.]|nr:glycoside hydrolase family 15 protein [Oligoflexia bacterium]